MILHVASDNTENGDKNLRRARWGTALTGMCADLIVLEKFDVDKASIKGYITNTAMCRREPAGRVVVMLRPHEAHWRRFFDTWYDVTTIVNVH